MNRRRLLRKLIFPTLLGLPILGIQIGRKVLQKRQASKANVAPPSPSPIVIWPKPEQPQSTAVAEEGNVSASPKQAARYIASSEGEKFHTPNCRWAANITAAHLRHFTTREAALNQGYSPCQTCMP